MSSLDHTATAQQLESISKRHKLTFKPTDTPAKKQQQQADQDTILGLADWHTDQAENQRKQENIFLLSEISKSAKKALIQTN